MIMVANSNKIQDSRIAANLIDIETIVTDYLLSKGVAVDNIHKHTLIETLRLAQSNIQRSINMF